MGLAHNGNLINAPELRRELEYTGAIFQTTIDSEVIAYHIARERLNSKSVEEAVGRAMTKIKGAYSLVVMSPRKLIGARDPYGFKPLCIGKRDHSYFLSSETCALDTVGAEFVRDVLPGEIVTISPEKGIESDTSHVLKPADTARCILSIFISPDLTALSMGSACMIPVFWQESSWLWIPRWMRIWSSAYRSPATALPWDIPCSPESLMVWAS